MISSAYIKTNFPLWSSYFTDDEEVASDSVLDTEIANGENKFLEYINVDAATITEPLRLHLFNIVRYRGFMRKHGDTVFENKPQIIKDYEETIKILTEYKKGTLSLEAISLGTSSQQIRITSRPRRFDTNFNPYDTTNSDVGLDI